MKVTNVVRPVIVVTLCLMLLPVLVFSDSIIYFVDGTSMQGDIFKSGTSNYFITRPNGKREIVPAGDIRAIRNGNETVYLDNSLPAENAKPFLAQTPSTQTQVTQQKEINNSERHEDKIYLDDGQVLTGKIVAQTPDSITIVSEAGQSDEINTKYIKRISRADNQPTVYPTIQANTEMSSYTNAYRGSCYNRTNRIQKEEFSIKVGPNILGRHTIKDGSIYYDGYTYEYSGTEDVNVGISLSAEYVNFVEDDIGLGVGITFQFPRQQSEINGDFSFMPIYALAKLRTLPDRRGRYFYGIGQLGYNMFSGNNEYKGDSGKLFGGLYTGIGCGYSAEGVFIELLYSIHHGSFKNSGYVLDFYPQVGYYYARFEEKGDISYSCLTINSGVKF